MRKKRDPGEIFTEMEKDYPVSTTRQMKSVRTLMKRGGYLPDPIREARLRRVTRMRNRLISDLGGDPSAAQSVLASNAAVFSVWLQDHTEKMLSGDGVDVKEFTNVAKAAQLTLTALGLERKPRDVMTIDSYLKDTTDDSADDAQKDADRS
jgi:hypothetical protein